MKTTHFILALLFTSCATATGALSMSPTEQTHSQEHCSIVAPERPTLSLEEARQFVPEELKPESVVVIAVPDYYANLFGDKRGFYTAAFFVVGQNFVEGYRGNTRPSEYGYSSAFGHYYPSLLPGIIRYKVGSYTNIFDGQKYPALVQASKAWAVRDDGERVFALMGTHCHAGGYRTTSSAGCQTVAPMDFPSFYATIRKAGVSEVSYVLIKEGEFWTTRAAGPRAKKF